jgi:quercetin dioxygenase-like cupin family protein
MTGCGGLQPSRSGRMLAGSTLAIPAGARHYGQNVGSEPVLNLDIYPVLRSELLPRTK